MVCISISHLGRRHTKNAGRKQKREFFFFLSSLKIIDLQPSEPLKFLFYDVPAANSLEPYADAMITNVSRAPLSP